MTKDIQFTLVSRFTGYRSKEDQTNLPESDTEGRISYLVPGSFNILNTTGGRIGIRKGYVLDGQADTTIVGIDSAFDYEMHTGDIRHLRAGNGKLQVRYVAESGDVYNGIAFTPGQVYWLDLSGVLRSTDFNFADWWDSVELQSRVLMVNGDDYINEWSGGITTLKSIVSASGGINYITKNGTTSWAEEGFSSTGTILINESPYVYDGGYGTTELRNITPDPALEPLNSVIMQQIVATKNSAMTSLPLVKNDLISSLNGHCYVGDFKNNSIYISSISQSGGIYTPSYRNYGFTYPIRLIGEGAIITLDSIPKGLVPQEDAMYVSAGLGQWYETSFKLSSDNSAENLSIKRLKTTSGQGALSQSAISKIKNSVVFISNEPTLDELGRVENILGTPQAVNYSDPIKNDFSFYDFTDAQVFYFKYFIYISVPQERLILIYNIAKGFWEAPQYIPVGKFSIIDNELYGHSYNTPETFKLFEGYNDNGNVISSKAIFSYNNYGMRMKTKYFNEFAVEGYINSNSIITLGIKYEIDGCATDISYDIKGTDTQIVCIPQSTASLGKESLGKHPFGQELYQTTLDQLPPKFRVIKTFPRKDFYEAQYSFSSLGKDQRWEILAFGSKVEQTLFGENDIKQ